MNITYRSFLISGAAAAGALLARPRAAHHRFARGLPAVVLLLGLALLPADGATGPARFLKKPRAWFDSEEGREAAGRILAYQHELGGWPKNIDTTADPATVKEGVRKPTFDNGATTDELRFLAKFYNATRDERARAAALRGIDYVLEAQYPSGGWPQSFPPGPQYHRHITFNDSAMTRVMEFLREAASDRQFAFVDEKRREAARKAFDRGVACILKCQIQTGGKRTAWCAQHDEATCAPRPGRAFEPVSISGSESVGVVRLLMSLENPSPEVVGAVESAVAWFEAAKIGGIRVESVPDARAPKGVDKVVSADPAAPPMWARFYEIGSNRPIYSDRDSIIKYELSQIGYERRNGYQWLNYWPRALLETEYPAWKMKHARAAQTISTGHLGRASKKDLP